jgi:hypothetical protein
MSILAAPGLAADAPRLEFGTVLGRVFTTWFQHLPGVVLVATVVYAPIVLWFLLPWLGVATPDLGVVESSRFTMVILSIPIVHTCAGGVATGIDDALSGRRAGLGGLLGPAVARAPAALAAALALLVVLALGFVMLVIPAIFASMAFAVTAPAAAVERLGPVRALRRSAELTRDHRALVFGVMFVVNVVGRVMDKLTTAIQAAVEGSSPVLGYLTAQLLVAGMMSLSAVALAVLYHDLRARERVDTEPLAEVFE